MILTLFTFAHLEGNSGVKGNKVQAWGVAWCVWQNSYLRLALNWTFLPVLDLDFLTLNVGNSCGLSDIMFKHLILEQEANRYNTQETFYKKRSKLWLIYKTFFPWSPHLIVTLSSCYVFVCLPLYLLCFCRFSRCLVWPSDVDFRRSV